MSRKRRGTVYAMRDGWRAQATIAGVRHCFGIWPTEEKARAVLAAALEQVGEAVHGRTLLAYGETWLNRREESKLVRGIRQERSTWKHHIARSDLASMPLHRIERKHVASWVRDLVQSEAVATIRRRGRVEHRPTGRPISRQTAQHALRLLRTCFEAAADEGLVRTNPAVGVRLPKSLPRNPAWTFLTLDEIEAVTSCAALDVHVRTAITVAIYTGLRKSELLALRWERIHLDGERPRIEVRGTVKSQSAIRDVPLLPPARQALLELRHLGGVRRVSGSVWPERARGSNTSAHPWRTRDYDFGWADHPEVVDGRKRVRPGAKTLAGITRHVRFHDLRHTCASHLLMGSWGAPLSLYQVRDWMGHSSIVVTQRYAHLAPDSIHGAARVLSSTFESHTNRTQRTEANGP